VEGLEAAGSVVGGSVEGWEEDWVVEGLEAADWVVGLEAAFKESVLY
jgi:hypothetical protein